MQKDYEQQLAHKEADRMNEIEQLKAINTLEMTKKEEAIQKMMKELEV